MRSPDRAVSSAKGQRTSGEPSYDLRITVRRILYGLAAMIAVLVVGTIIGLIWADTSNVAGGFAVATNIIGAIGIVLLLVALVVKRRQQGLAGAPPEQR